MEELQNKHLLKSDERTAVILANMGAPGSEKEMKTFLKRMFMDKAIIYVPLPVRILLSAFISNLRYKSSWRKYMQIGGSPLQKSMNSISGDLQQLLSSNYPIYPVYSYSEPFIENKLRELYGEGFRQFFVISMYPQSSFSTVGSVLTSLQKFERDFQDIRLHYVEDFYNDASFIQYWSDLIRGKINIEGYAKPFLLFSSHAIPQSFVDRGDIYCTKSEESARLIADQLGMPYCVSYQSKIGPTNWTKPYTVETLLELSKNNVNEIIIVPLSFINENLETRYDLDVELIPYAKNVLKIKNISRVEIPMSDQTLVKMFHRFITSTK